MDRKFRALLIGVRQVSGKVDKSVDDILLSEVCASLAGLLRQLWEDALQREAEDFWRRVCMERYAGRAKMYVSMPADGLRERADHIYGAIACVSDRYIDTVLRAQVRETCGAFVVVCDTMLQPSALHLESEPVFDTWLGRPRLTLVISR